MRPEQTGAKPAAAPTTGGTVSDLAPGLWMALGFITLYFVLQWTVSFCAAAAIVLARGNPGGRTGPIGERIQTALAQPDLRSAVVILTLAGAALPILWLVRRSWPKLWPMSQPPGFGFVLPARSGFFALAGGIGLAAPIVGSWLTQLLARGHPVPQDIRQLGTQASPVLRMLLVMLVASLGPVVEELLFRGLLLSALLRRLHVAWAVVASALLFALIHLPGLQWHGYALPALTLLALALAWLRLRSGSIWPAVLAHAINNLLAVTVWFVAVKPPA